MLNGAMALSKETDLTKGKIFPQIIAFALPLMMGSLFQQLYNTVDTWVVGNYVGKISFSAVGTIGPVLNTLIGFFTGFSAGAGVVISQFYGAGNTNKVKDSVHTYVFITLILCLFFTVLGFLVIPLMIKILNSPEDVAVQQTIYLRIYYAGFSGLLIYNMGASIMRAVGNSKFPFILLVICALSNIVLDLLFVLVFHMGTAGVAWATIISQGISAIVVVVELLKTDSVVKIRFRDLRINKNLAKKIFVIGLPTAIQMSITAFSNVFVQSYINYFGTDVMGGWTAYGKLDQLFFLPMQSIGVATTTFVGQNIGKNDIARARKGSLYSLYLAWACTSVLVLLVAIAAPQLVSLFISSEETGVIYYGALFLRCNGPFFLAACVNQVLGGSLRGCGKSGLSMIAMLGSFVVFRQIYLFILTKFISNTILPVAMCYPAGWMVCSIVVFIFYLKYFPKVTEKAF